MVTMMRVSAALKVDVRPTAVRSRDDIAKQRKAPVIVLIWGRAERWNSTMGERTQ